MTSICSHASVTAHENTCCHILSVLYMSSTVIERKTIYLWQALLTLTEGAISVALLVELVFSITASGRFLLGLMIYMSSRSVMYSFFDCWCEILSPSLFQDIPLWLLCQGIYPPMFCSSFHERCVFAGNFHHIFRTILTSPENVSYHCMIVT